MSPAAPPLPAHTGEPALALARPWQAWLLWAGGVACLAGIVGHQLFAEWIPARSTALLVIALIALGAAWALRRFTGIALAHGLACAWLLALAWLGGPLPLLATALAALAAAALGGLLLPRAGIAAQCVVGIALGAGVLGWLLPLPLHSRWSYLAGVLLLLGWRHRALRSALRVAAGAWSRTVAAAPRPTAWMLLVLGLAATACWVPTMQYDDIGYHLLLPWSLQLDGQLAMDPDVHAWALAPWAADVVQAVPQLLAGVEARGAVNATWLLLCAAATWRLCEMLGGDLRARAWSVLLFASLPLTAVLALGMQTELASAALLAWATLAGHGAPSRRRFLAGCALAGLLIASKLSAAGFALLLLPWLAWRHRAALDARTLVLAPALLLVLGGSSYAYAWAIAGNPVLPLMNDVFGSPYFGGAFVDTRWHAGLHPLLPWRLTFDTGRYLEAYPGGGGFVLVALAGAWVLALLERRTRVHAALALAMLVLPLLATQYLRYVYPALVLALPALVVAALRAAPRSAHVLLAATCIANLLFQANGHWMLRGGAVKDSVVVAGRDAPVLLEYAPERVLAAKLRAARDARGEDTDAGRSADRAVLVHDIGTPMLAELGAAARTTSWYDPSLAAATANAQSDPGGAAWVALWREAGIGDLVLHADRTSAAQRQGLARAGAVRQGAVGDLEWWWLPPAADVPRPSLEATP